MTTLGVVRIAASAVAIFDSGNSPRLGFGRSLDLPSTI
jgi:hypothetical protein